MTKTQHWESDEGNQGHMSEDQQLRTMLGLAPEEGPYPDGRALSVGAEMRPWESRPNGVRGCWPPPHWLGWGSGPLERAEAAHNLIGLYRWALQGVDRELRQAHQRIGALEMQLERARSGSGGSQ